MFKVENLTYNRRRNSVRSFINKVSKKLVLLSAVYKSNYSLNKPQKIMKLSNLKATRMLNTCRITGLKKAYIKSFLVSRHMIKSRLKKIPGLRKAS
jgi:ribosomal protein S14